MKLKIRKRTGLRVFSYQDIGSWKPCYAPSNHIKETWRGTAIDILSLENVPIQDRLWCVIRPEICSERLMRLFAIWSARQVQHLMSDHKCLQALDVAEAFANGKATEEELQVAYTITRYAVDYADFARSSTISNFCYTSWYAYHSANAAYYAAYYAAGSAAMSAASSAQIAKLKEMLLVEGQERLNKRRR